MTVRNGAGSFDFRLFDHIQVCLSFFFYMLVLFISYLFVQTLSLFHFQVRISFVKSRAHAQSLRLELLSLETRQTPPLSEMAFQDDVSNAMKRSELVKVCILFVFAFEQKIFKIFSNAVMLKFSCLSGGEVKS